MRSDKNNKHELFMSTQQHNISIMWFCYNVVVWSLNQLLVNLLLIGCCVLNGREDAVMYSNVIMCNIGPVRLQLWTC